MENRMWSLARLFCGAMAMLVAAGGANAASGQSAVAGSPGAQQKVCGCSSLPTLAHGYHVEVYAHVDQPEKLSFSRDGSLYVGNGTDQIHKIGPGGHPVIAFGPPQLDPDAVLADDDGRISGHRHSVLVGGDIILAAIYRNQQSAVIFFNSGFEDVDDMKFDRNGRLLFADDAPWSGPARAAHLPSCSRPQPGHPALPSMTTTVFSSHSVMARSGSTARTGQRPASSRPGSSRASTSILHWPTAGADSADLYMP